mmetsp:Transcript_32630/g.75842  ORF Transcript_32630/g.75842 Transcript_32630/m.75842 type:complete len:432 (+) Transcript_32630:77-1372(+)
MIRACLWLLPSVAAAGVADAVPMCTPGKPYPKGMHELRMTLAGLPRRALLYVPPGYRPTAGVPVLVVPQAFGWSAEFNIQHSALLPVAVRRNFSIIELDAPGLAINVALDGRANPLRPDDVAYTSAVLNEVDRVLCLDARRIFCVGFSRGARFCSRLASERSDIFAAISALSGLRYPRPNNATRPVPVVTFHGTADTVNPYLGGGPPYWQTSVDDAVSGWVVFNKCGKRVERSLGVKQQVIAFTDCQDNADVVFIKTVGGGHEWPSARYGLSGYPLTAPKADDFMMDFFMAHPLPFDRNKRETPSPVVSSVAAARIEPDLHGKADGVGENVPANAATRMRRSLTHAWESGIRVDVGRLVGGRAGLLSPAAAAALSLATSALLLLLAWRRGRECRPVVGGCDSRPTVGGGAEDSSLLPCGSVAQTDVPSSLA